MRQTAVCTATAALGIQFAVELSSCMQAKVTLKSDMFASLRLQRDVKVHAAGRAFITPCAHPPTLPAAKRCVCSLASGR